MLGCRKKRKGRAMSRFRSDGIFSVCALNQVANNFLEGIFAHGESIFTFVREIYNTISLQHMLGRKQNLIYYSPSEY